MFKKYGNLTVLNKISSERSLCVCDCGTFLVVSRPNRIKVTHCGCLKVKDVIGKIFGDLKVLKVSSENRFSNLDFDCICTKCGEICKRNILGKVTKLKCLSCNQSGKLGKSEKYTYSSYKNMVQRCTNPSSKFYENYGGKGIAVCRSWLESFDNFFLDMGRRPKNTSLDRIDWNLGYSKENCRWATQSEQVRNRTKVSSLYSKYRGVSYSKSKGKFSSFICHQGRTIFLGYYNSEDEAALAYNFKAVELNFDQKYLNELGGE